VHQGWNAQGIWMGYLVALVLQAVMFVSRFFVLVRRDISTRSPMTPNDVFNDSQ
jgi:hypothetical protein